MTLKDEIIENANYSWNGHEGKLEEKDVKQFLKDLNEFIDDKTLQMEGLTRVIFFPFEFEEFLKEKVGDF